MQEWLEGRSGSDRLSIPLFKRQVAGGESWKVFSRLGHSGKSLNGLRIRIARGKVIGAIRGRSRSATILAVGDSASVRNVPG